MVYVTGDCHGNFQRFGMRYLPGQKAMDRDDYIIVCGDFGFWSDTPEEEYWLDWLEKKPFTILWADGNHENFARLNELPVHKWHGGKVHFIRPHVIHLMRGQLYSIEGCTFFTMGGAQSHDIEDGILDPEASDFEETLQRLRDRDRKRFRILGRSWWPEELPSDAEYMEALNTLELAGWKADYVITHCAPTSIARTMNRHYQPDALTDFLELVNRKLDFKCWFLGHYHGNRALTAKHILLWEQIVQIL